jgi:predicted permease
MQIDWSLLFWVWLCGLGCGALCWYWVLKFFPSEQQSGHGQRNRD